MKIGTKSEKMVIKVILNVRILMVGMFYCMRALLWQYFLLADLEDPINFDSIHGFIDPIFIGHNM